MLSLSYFLVWCGGAHSQIVNSYPRIEILLRNNSWVQICRLLSSLPQEKASREVSCSETKKLLPQLISGSMFRFFQWYLVSFTVAHCRSAVLRKALSDQSHAVCVWCFNHCKRQQLPATAMPQELIHPQFLS